MKCRELVSVAELTTSERAAFVNAMLALKTAPSLIAAAATAVTAGGGTPNRYDDYVWMHNTVGASAHFGSAFGPWHREFLRQFEFDLRQVAGNPDIVIPYWDWTTGRAAGDANWPFTDDLLGPLGDAAGIVQTGPFSNSATWRMNIRRTLAVDGVNDTNVGLRRRPAATPAGFNLPTAANARAGAAHALPYDAVPYNEASLLNALFTPQPGETPAQTNARITAQINTWTAASFRKFLEWVLHNGVHTWVGGSDGLVSAAFIGGPMAFPPVAVNDPTFWLHHCNVDRLWSTWQQRNPSASYVPVSGGDPGHNLNDEMRHFEAANSADFNTPLRSHPADVLDSRGVLNVWYTSDLPVITLVTPSVNFGDVPANLTTDWPVKFDVRTCRTGPARVKFRITGIAPGTNFSTPAGQGDVPAEHSDAHDPVRANVFVEFHAVGTPSVVQSGTVTVGAFVNDTEGYYSGTVGSELQVGTWTVGLQARPVPVPSAAVTLVLDRSGSMNDSVGPAGTKYDLLKSSLRVIASVMRNDDAIGLVSFDDVVTTLTPAITPMGTVTPPGAGRQAVETAITSGGLTPRNLTAIGDGMIAGATLLQTVQSDPTYPTKAMVVMTDGINTAGTEPSAMSVHTAVSWFSNQVYAIGLGDETSIDTVRLNDIARYLLVTGTISSNEQRFLLTKYFLQVLAQVSNAAIVVDPMGELRPGDEHRIPFSIADSDVSLRAIALCPLAALLDVRFEAPDGTVIRPGVSPNVTGHVDTEDVVCQALLPAIPSNTSGTHGGEWTAVLRIRDFKSDGGISRENLTSVRGALSELDPQAVASVARLRALPYQLFVQTESNLKMEVEVQQGDYRPGTVLTLLAGLKEYLVPMNNRAQVVVEVTDPAGAETHVTLEEVAPGRFRSTYATTIQGIYRCRFRGRGTTRGGKPFQREELRTAAVNAKLDTPVFQPGSGTPGGGGDRDDHKRWCALLECLLGRRSIDQFLRKHDIDPAELQACVKRVCATMGSVQRPATDLQRDGGTAMATDETEKLRRTIEALRSELRSRGAGSPGILDDLLVEGPIPIPVPPLPKVTVNEEAESHHRHPLPFLVLDDEGKPERVVIPHGAGMGGEMGNDPHDDPGHEHGHSEPKPPKRK